jgi:MerR family transcriptional regulator, copper efflux regulator
MRLTLPRGTGFTLPAWDRTACPSVMWPGAPGLADRRFRSTRTGILPPSRRTEAGYRVYGQQTLALLAFVAQARRLGFHLDEIKEVVQIKRSGRCPCPHVLDLVRQKVEELDRTPADLTEVRHGLQEILRSSARSMQRGKAVVCHHIERLKLVKGRR